MKPHRAISAIISFALTTGAALATGDGIGIPYEDTSRVDAGAALYAENCAACHGENREGGVVGDTKAPPLDGTGHASHHGPEHLFKIVKHGASSMPNGDDDSPMAGFGGMLTDQEILSVLAYIKSNWPEDVIASHNGGHGH